MKRCSHEALNVSRYARTPQASNGEAIKPSNGEAIKPSNGAAIKRRRH
ncbi:MAG: hypothetical protein II088_01415 [Bacteroidales bacterium]|nr:hypothetical protein [Bacteroidales bacterium]